MAAIARADSNGRLFRVSYVNARLQGLGPSSTASQAGSWMGGGPAGTLTITHMGSCRWQVEDHPVEHTFLTSVVPGHSKSFLGIGGPASQPPWFPCLFSFRLLQNGLSRHTFLVA